MKKNWKESLMMVIDIMFVLILCFVVLLTTMLVTKSIGGTDYSNGYTINWLILGGVVVSLVVYLGFMLKTSMKSLNDLVNKYFEAHKDEEVDA
ncbi:MAG: hypothetical protein IJV74_03740 [Clostridia bacterium]|nr:hypothetical protein [Clostridia bacterium]